MMDRIIDVNNKAVNLLSQSGDYFGAAFFLCKALETMNGYEYPSVDEEEDNSESNMSSSGTIRLVPTRAREVSTTLVVDASPISLYDKAFFVISPSANGSSTVANEARCMNSLCPILLYNLALSLQLQGISDRRIQLSSFHESSILYHSASDLLDDVATASGGDATSKNEANTLLHLALFNNLGHIYYQLSRFTEAQECLNHVKSMLPVSTDNQWGDGEEGGEYQHFFASVLVNAGQHTRTSPAA
jgi:tetratricopeptide (TPR) repeat protein